MTGVRFAGDPAALRRAVSAFADAEISTEEAFRWGWLAQLEASALWDHDTLAGAARPAGPARPRGRRAR